MKFIHTSDWHLGQRFFRFDRDEEHRHFFDQLAGLLRREMPDALLVSGDIFDSALPTAQVQSLFVEELLRLHEASPGTRILLTAGNHDSGSRLEVMKPLLRPLNIDVFGCVRRTQEGGFDPAQFIVRIERGGRNVGWVLAIPYFHPWNFPAAEPDLERDKRQRAFFRRMLEAAATCNGERLPVVMMAHLAVAGCEVNRRDEGVIGQLESQPLEVLGTGYDYLALGHIHRPQNIATERARYCGSPFAMSFSEEFAHSVAVVEIDRHGDDPRVRCEEIRPLREVKSLPVKPASLEEGIEALRALAEEDPSYVRVVVSAAEPLPPDAEARALEAVRDKQCRLCEVRREAKTRAAAGQADASRFDEVGQIQAIRPEEIAGEAFARKYGTEMNDELRTLLRQAITDVTESNRQ